MAVDVVGASVVTVAVGVVPVDTTTTLDLTNGALAVEELIVLVVTGGDAGRYGSVTSMYPGVVATTVDVADEAIVAGEVDAAAPIDDVVACFLDGVVIVGANSDASSEMTTASWKSISSSGMGCVVVAAGVAICCCRAASSSGV